MDENCTNNADDIQQIDLLVPDIDKDPNKNPDIDPNKNLDEPDKQLHDTSSDEDTNFLLEKEKIKQIQKLNEKKADEIRYKLDTEELLSKNCKYTIENGNVIMNYESILLSLSVINRKIEYLSDFVETNKSIMQNQSRRITNLEETINALNDQMKFIIKMDPSNNNSHNSVTGLPKYPLTYPSQSIKRVATPIAKKNSSKKFFKWHK